MFLLISKNRNDINDRYLVMNCINVLNYVCMDYYIIIIITQVSRISLFSLFYWYLSYVPVNYNSNNNNDNKLVITVVSPYCYTIIVIKPPLDHILTLVKHKNTRFASFHLFVSLIFFILVTFLLVLVIIIIYGKYLL